LGGKYKNKRMVVKEIGKDELGQPTVNGKPMLKFRIEKHLPDNKKSKKTLDAEKEEKEKEKLDEQESGLPPGMEGFGFDDEEPDEPVGSTVGMREIERNFGTYASESKASRYLKPAGLAFLKRYGDGRESIQIYEKGNVLGWAVELSKVTDASTAKNIGQKIKKNLWGKRSPKLTSQQWHLHDLPMWVAYDEGAERIEAPKPPPPRQGTLFESWRGYLNEGSGFEVKGSADYFRVEMPGVGYAEGQYNLRFKECEDDVDALKQTAEYLEAEEQFQSNPKNVWGDGEPKKFRPRFYDVTNAWISNPEKRGKGFGKEIYKAFIDKAIEYSKSYGGVFIGAHHCTIGSGTSDAAKRVWKSITRDYTSSGDVIFIGTAQ
jgi:hypothetical protein